jgi:hypothetical protein
MTRRELGLLKVLVLAQLALAGVALWMRDPSLFIASCSAAGACAAVVYRELRG